MGSIVKVKDGNWKIRWDEPGSTRDKRKRKQKSGFKTKGEASRCLRDIENAIHDGSYGKVEERITVDQAFKLWFEKHVYQLKPKTKDGYVWIYEKYISPYFGTRVLEDIRPIEIAQFYEELQSTTSEDNTFRVHKIFRSCINKVYQWEFIDRRILDRVGSPSQPKPEIEYWYPDQTEHALLNFVMTTDVSFHIYTALKAGMRLGEICALTLDDFDFDHNLLLVNKSVYWTSNELIITEPKTKNSIRKIPMTSEMIAFYKKYTNKMKSDRLKWGPVYNKNYLGYLSVFENGDFMSPDYVSKRFTKDLKKYDKLPKITFHALRHTFASNHVYKGTQLNVLQKLLGHATLSTTSDIYAHINPEMLRKAQENI